MTFETEYLLFFVLAPILGLIFSILFEKKVLLQISTPFIILSTPILFGYDLLTNWTHELNFTIILSCMYGYWIFNINKWRKIRRSLLLSTVLLIILGYAAFVDAFVGSNYIEQTWIKNEYQINYIRSQGFSGRPAFYYEIIHKPFNGLFRKKSDQKGIEKTPCNILFKDQSIEINICKT